MEQASGLKSVPCKYLWKGSRGEWQRLTCVLRSERSVTAKRSFCLGCGQSPDATGVDSSVSRSGWGQGAEKGPASETAPRLTSAPC